MHRSDIRKGLRVVVTELGGTEDFQNIKEEHLAVRRKGVVGIVGPSVLYHSNTVWLIFHDGSDEIGAYQYDEFELRPD